MLLSAAEQLRGLLGNGGGAPYNLQDMRSRMPRDRAWMVAGIVVTTVVWAADAAQESQELLTAVLAGPLIAAIGATVLEVAIVGAYAIAAAIALGEVNDIFLDG